MRISFCSQSRHRSASGQELLRNHYSLALRTRPHPPWPCPGPPPLLHSMASEVGGQGHVTPAQHRACHSVTCVADPTARLCLHTCRYVLSCQFPNSPLSLLNVAQSGYEKWKILRMRFHFRRICPLPAPYPQEWSH